MSNSIDQQFVEFVVKSLVSKPNAVVVERRIDEKGVLLELTVDPEDLGRVIGKRGATAQSIRTLLRALGTKNDARYNLKIVDNGPERPDRPERRENNQNAQQQSAQNGGGLWGDDGTSSDDTTNDSGQDSSEPVAAVEELAAQIDKDTSDSSDFSKTDEPEAPEEKPAEDTWAKTRKELADLDD